MEISEIILYFVMEFIIPLQLYIIIFLYLDAYTDDKRLATEKQVPLRSSS